MKYVPKAIEREVNVTPVHPLVNFGYLLGTVVLGLLLAYIILGFVADWLVGHISPEDEVRIGQNFFQPLSERVVERADCQQYLDGLLTTLHQPAEPLPVPLSLHVIQAPQPNAAILPGGRILVTTALLQAAESENELAFVLAHELGHFYARDPLRAMGRSLVWSVLLSAVVGSSQGDRVATTTAQLTTLTYRREQELAADRYALAALVRRYQHASHSLDFFARLQQQTDGARVLQPLTEYFSTHPLPDNRIEALQQLVQERGWSLEGETTALPALSCFRADAPGTE